MSKSFAVDFPVVLLPHRPRDPGETTFYVTISTDLLLNTGNGLQSFRVDHKSAVLDSPTILAKDVKYFGSWLDIIKEKASEAGIDPSEAYLSKVVFKDAAGIPTSKIGRKNVHGFQAEATYHFSLKETAEDAAVANPATSPTSNSGGTAPGEVAEQAEAVEHA